MEAPALNIRLHPRQYEALSSPATEILFGGSAGGGKSYLIRAALITWSVAIPGLQCYLFRRYYPELKQTHMEGPTSFPKMLQALIASGHCRIVGREIRFWNGSRIFMANAESDDEVHRYRSYEFHVLAIDEASTFSDSQFRFLRSRCRVSGIETGKQWGDFPRILLASNPGGLGHAWLKEGFVRARPERKIERMPPSEGGFMRQFIPSRLADNPSLDAEQYAATLSGLGDPALVRAMLDGDWDVVSGAMYGDVWRRDVHLSPPFPIPVDWQIWLGCDDGYQAPASVVWLTQDPKSKIYYAIDQVHSPLMLPEVMAKRIKETHSRIPRIGTRGELPNADPIDGIIDSAAMSDSGQGIISRGKQLEKLGVKLRPCDKWHGSRAHRAQRLHQLLAIQTHGKAGIRFFPACRHLISTIPTLPRDPNRPEEVDTDADDHCFIAGTLVRTSAGNRRIEEIKPGDLVATRLGFYPVLANWCRRSQPVITRGMLTGTASHKVWTDQGWKRLELLTQSDTVCTWQKWRQQITAGWNTSGILIHPTERPGFILGVELAMASNIYTGEFTKTIRERFLLAATSITETATLETILQKIWSCSLHQSTAGSTTRSAHTSTQKSSGQTLERPLRLLGDGMAARLEEPGTSSMENEWPAFVVRAFARFARDPFRATGRSQFALKNAKKSETPTQQRKGASKASMISLGHVQFAEPATPQTNTRAERPAPGDVADVYNLTVAGPGEYFANDTLVQNCFDALTYGLQWRDLSAKRVRIGGV